MNLKKASFYSCEILRKSLKNKHHHHFLNEQSVNSLNFAHNLRVQISQSKFRSQLSALLKPTECHYLSILRETQIISRISIKRNDDKVSSNVFLRIS